MDKDRWRSPSLKQSSMSGLDQIKHRFLLVQAHLFLKNKKIKHPKNKVNGMKEYKYMFI